MSTDTTDARQSLVVLDDARLVALMSDAKFKSSLPCFKQSARVSASELSTMKKTGCRSCGGRKNQEQLDAQRAFDILRDLKRCIKGMPRDQKRTLKRLLAARKVRVNVPVSDRKVVKITF